MQHQQALAALGVLEVLGGQEVSPGELGFSSVPGKALLGFMHLITAQTAYEYHAPKERVMLRRILYMKSSDSAGVCNGLGAIGR